MKRIAIAGAGYSGCILANKLAQTGQYHVDLFESRDHIGGNCHTAQDPETGVMVHTYGPHIFNTSNKMVWDYVNQLTPFRPYIHQVQAVTHKGIFPLPINLNTINAFFERDFTPEQAQKFIESQTDQSIEDPQTFEEQALKFVGKELYEAFFQGYTRKQWGIDPTELPASILKRLPVRFTKDNNYYRSKYQGIPELGYTPIFEKLTNHENISVSLNTSFEKPSKSNFDHIFYTGPLDAYFDFDLGRLAYRTLTFEKFTEDGDFQGWSQVNYCQEDIPFTRITEHKHFTPWQSFDQTICFREFSSLAGPNDIPYYPIRLVDDKKLLENYQDLAFNEKGVSFVGRLATYRYLDMDVVIAEALQMAQVCLEKPMNQWPTFPEPQTK